MQKDPVTKDINSHDSLSNRYIIDLKLVISPCLRNVWRHKGGIVGIAIVLYVSIFIAMYTLVSASRLKKPKNIDLQKLIVLQMEHFHHPMYSNITLASIDLKFKTFRKDPKRNNYTRDFLVEFPCKRNINILYANYSEDIMCLPRPKYLKEFQNPCYRDQNSNMTLCVPFFHLLGADKCGTTDFFSRLSLHPEILENNGGIGKETYYWCWLRYGLWMDGKVAKRTFSKYILNFLRPSAKIARANVNDLPQLITGDGTPMDFWDFRGWYIDPQNIGLQEPRFLTPHAMRHMYKNPKFILLFREPVERLYSDYIFLGHGHSAEKFAKDVPIAIETMQKCLAKNTTRQCFFSDDMYHKLNMRIHISCYSVFLREWLAVFDHRHFLILRSEDVHANTSQILQQTFQFLGVRQLPEEDVRKIANRSIQHITLGKANAGKVLPETRQLLQEFYRPCNEDLANLLNDERFLWRDF